jgi:hypothetical protein
MSRIRLRNLLNLTEQAPQAPMPDLGAPVAAPVAPPPGMNAGQQDQQQPQEPPDTGPQPEDPGEYDFTKDFREFEDKKNKAEAEAKKVVLDKMNEKLMGKTITANASRGYGQPKTDYTIKNVKKVSVEFWYKDYVVIVSDENEKKYFLTPGINVKIEGSGSEAAPAGQEAAPEAQPGAEAQPQAGAGEEAPNVPDAGGAPTTAGTGAEPAGQPAEAPPTTTGTEPPPAQPGAAPAQPGQPAQQTTPQDMGVPQQEIPPKKKKKVPVAEFVQRDLNTILGEFMSDKVKNDEGMVNFLPYIKESNKILAEVANSTKVQCQLLIPENHMTSRVDLREIQLSAVDTMRQKSYYGQYSKGYINLAKNGRYYLLEYVKEVGWNS